MTDEAKTSDPLAGLRAELTVLRERIIGVRGSVVAGVDGLYVFQDGAPGQDPHDIAAMAAATYGIGQQAGRLLNSDSHYETTIHCRDGYLVVYSIDDRTLLAVIAEAGVNVARLHVEFRASREVLHAAIQQSAEHLAATRPKIGPAPGRRGPKARGTQKSST